jgi:neutral ceramidase
VRKKMGSIRLGVKKINITPDWPVSLLGYFNERISKGVLDPLYCRMAALEGEKGHLLFVQLDSCLILKEDADRLKSLIEATGAYRQSEILVFTNHTHTAPALTDFFKTRRESRYVDWLIGRVTEEAALLRPEKSYTTKIASSSYAGLSYNRRWYMDDGTVATNPPKRSPRMKKPEGPVDRTVQVVVFQSAEGSLDAFFVNISNHTDTIGGKKISADWTGFMESFIQDELGTGITVFPLIAPQGNINHFEFGSEQNQTSYEEARRLGRAYAREVIDAVRTCTPFCAERLSARTESIQIPPRKVTGSQIKQAQALINDFQPGEDDRNLTSEDIFKGDLAVERLFAEELLQFVSHRPREYGVPLQIVRLGEIAFCTLPGEPFVEIGLHLKSVSGPNTVFPVALANGYFGYIPLRECFGRGGYEIRATVRNCLSRKAAELIVAWHSNELQGR